MPFVQCIKLIQKSIYFEIFFLWLIFLLIKKVKPYFLKLQLIYHCKVLVMHSGGMNGSRHRLDHEKPHLDIKKPFTKKIRLAPDVADSPACKVFRPAEAWRNLVKLDLL